jgi:hypothetical protein
VDLAVAGHPQHENEESTVVDLMDDPVVACAHPPPSCSTDEALGGRWSRMLCEQPEHCLDTTPDRRVERAELSGGCRRQLNDVGHDRPSSALTTSQGIGSRPVDAISILSIGQWLPRLSESPTAVPDTVEPMPDRNSDWTPRTVGEAREYLDAHEPDGDPEIVRACEALVDATPHLSDFAKAPAEHLEERGAD